jgi:hypothetical protein
VELARAGLAAGELDELEDHLRTQFAELQALGLEGAEAWLVAERRLGPPHSIAREFGTVESRLPSPLIWMTVGALALSLGANAVHVTGYLTRYASGSDFAAWIACGLALPLILFAMIRWGAVLLSYPVRVLALLLAAKAAWYGWVILINRILTASEIECYWVGSGAAIAFWGLSVLITLGLILARRWRSSAELAS